MKHTPTPEVEKAVSLLWELAEGHLDDNDLPAIRRIAGLLERMDEENQRLKDERPAA